MLIFGHTVRLYGNNFSVIQFLFIRSSKFGLMTLARDICLIYKGRGLFGLLGRIRAILWPYLAPNGPGLPRSKLNQI